MKETLVISPATTSGSGSRVARFNSRRCFFHLSRAKPEPKATFKIVKLKSRLGNYYVRVPCVPEKDLHFDAGLAGKLIRLRADHDADSEAA